MSTSEVIPHPAPPVPEPAQRPPLSREEIDVIKDMYFKNGTDAELKLFVHVCNQKQLSPFNHQIHAIQRWDPMLKRNAMTFQVAIDGFRLIADRTGRYEGQDGPYWCGADGKWVDVWLDSKNPPVAAKVGVLKKGFAKPLYAVALHVEYVQLTRDGEVNSIWRKRPAGQLAKCAEALAFRMAFPEELSGLYTGDEMGQADNTPEPPPPRTTPTATTAAPAAAAIGAGPQEDRVPDAVLLMWSRITNIKGTCEVFADLKTWLKELGGEGGEKEYYRILKEYGNVDHANQFKSTKPAKICSRKMWEAVQQAEMLKPEQAPDAPLQGEQQP